MRENLPWKKVFKWIFFSTLATWSLASVSWIYWRHRQQELASNDRYNIVAIWQVCRHKEPLQTDFLAELLELSCDQPTNLYRFDIKAAKQKLLAYPVIKSAEIKKVMPGMLFVEYSLRQPIAYLAEYSNTAIDAEGVLIPSKPFYTPKNLHEWVLGLPKGLEWGTKISGKGMLLIHELIEVFNLNENVRLTRIDVSKAFSKIYGEREIVLFVEELIEGKEGIEWDSKRMELVLRLSPDNWREQIANYVMLRPVLKAEGKGGYVVDLRISELAYYSLLGMM